MSTGLHNSTANEFDLTAGKEGFNKFLFYFANVTKRLNVNPVVEILSSTPMTQRAIFITVLNARIQNGRKHL
eukprot:TRINITY_DN1033_c0_g1_i1.p1 TRINITY_DN1033_c0_g1~~TRINITY_DN1033_c0_g1_i1.p1  ORF type:complete len:72 (+),score=4.39 TRINITY_DN1033_c0_g1_i1:147-362(+)